MPDGNGFYPPEQYSPLWLLLGILILFAILAWYVIVLVSTRRKRAAVESAPVGIPFPDLRQNSLARIDETQQSYAAGALDFGRAHQQLSLIVREFAAGAVGVRAQYLTLEDLRAMQLGPLSQTVGELYPGAFSGTAVGSVEQAADRARRLVALWQ